MESRSATRSNRRTLAKTRKSINKENIMKWKQLHFGIHQGETLPQILFHDPDWFFFTYGRGIFGEFSFHQLEAAIIHAKARWIRIPQTKVVTLNVEYKFNPDGSCVGFDLVPADSPQHQGSTPTRRSDHINMSVPHQVARYDKLGNRLFLRSLKSCLFGDPSARMTRERCEDFFNDDSKFHRNE